MYKKDNRFLTHAIQFNLINKQRLFNAKSMTNKLD